jgi:hypothetical protein
MINKLKMFIFLGLLMIGVVFTSGCVQEKAPTNTQLQEANPLVGTWKNSRTDINGNTYDAVYHFGEDYNGFVDTGRSTTIFPVNGKGGKTFFKYNIQENKLTLYDFVPCTPKTMLYTCQPTQPEYKFYDKNTLVISGDVFEKSWW